MSDYNFQTLNDREFEKLARDLLQREMGLTLESFKPGRDGGIDLRHSSPPGDATVIVQAKHRTRSSFSQLFHHLKKEELNKVKKLKPSRYILVTSTEFNPQQKQEILNLFSPYILTTGDIYGRDDINGLLARFPNIETDHPKLWLSSVPVLKKILKNGISGRSEFAEDTIVKNISLYVANQKYADALKVLNRERFLVIVGEPGIGKTVLARMLIYHLLGKGYKLVHISENISEGEDIYDTDSKQVFYFDDFLGANYLELAQQQNRDASLINFIERIKNNPRKRLILTSRTTVLNNGMHVYQRLNNPRIDLAKHEVKIQDYSKLDKAQILYNHLYFFGLEEAYWGAVREDRNYWKIINHGNYNPRLIEFISDPIRLNDVKAKDYMAFIIERLDNPAEIWRHPYQNQTDEYGKFLIQTLFSLGDSVKESVLKKAFDARLDYEIKNNNFKRESKVFELRIKHLMGGFIKAERSGSSEPLFSFFNPSITDFFLNELAESDEKWRVIESAIYTSQLDTRFSMSSLKSGGKIPLSDEERSRLYQVATRKENDLLHPEGGSPQIELLYLLFFSSFSLGEEGDCYLARLLERLDMDKALSSQSYGFVQILLEVKSGNGVSSEVVKKRWKDFVDYLFRSITVDDEWNHISELFELYGEDIIEYVSDATSHRILQTSLDKFWNQEISDIEDGVADGMAEICSNEEMDSYIVGKYEEGASFYRRFGVDISTNLKKILEIDAESLIEQNKERIQREDVQADYHKDEYYIEREQQREMDSKIDQLFQ